MIKNAPRPHIFSLMATGTIAVPSIPKDAPKGAVKRPYAVDVNGNHLSPAMKDHQAKRKLSQAEKKRKALAFLATGEKQISEFEDHLGASNSNCWSVLKGLREEGLVENVRDGNYRAWRLVK